MRGRRGLAIYTDHDKRRKKNKRDLWALRYRDSSDTHTTQESKRAHLCVRGCVWVCACAIVGHKNMQVIESQTAVGRLEEKKNNTHRITPLHSTNDETERKRE